MSDDSVAGETGLGEKRTITMLDCREFSCRKCIYNRHILKTELNTETVSVFPRIKAEDRNVSK